MTKKQLRESVRIGMNIIVALPDGREMSGWFSRNMSEKGLFLEIYPLIAIGEKVRLSFRLPTRNRLLEVDGIVRWSRDDDDTQGPAGIGIEFLNPSDDFIEEVKAELNYSID